MANIFRGEVDICLGGKSYVMRPTFQALCEIEHVIGKSIVVLIHQFEEKGILLGEQEAIIKAGLKAAGEVIPEDIGALMVERGTINTMEAVCDFLHYGVNGHHE